jgi:hypothetical protein
MKKIMAALLVAALVAGSVFAADGFTAVVEVKTDVAEYQLYSGSGETGFDLFKGNSTTAGISAFPSGDTEVKFAYADPDKKYGAQLNILDLFDGAVGYGGQWKVGDVFAWAQLGPARVKLGKYTERAYVNIGNDKHGVLDENRKDPVVSGMITNYDVFGFGGLLVDLGFGPANIWLNASIADEGFKVLKDGETVPDYDQDGIFKNADVLRNYKYGVAGKYKLGDIADIAVALTLGHTGGAGTEAGWVNDADTLPIYDWIDHDDDPQTPKIWGNKNGSLGVVEAHGNVFTGFGLYGNVTAIPDLAIGLGYYGYKINPDEKSDDKHPKTKYAPLRSAIDLDLAYTGIDKLTLSLFNNFSFYTYEKKYYGAADTLKDSSVFVLYNELSASYKLSDPLTAALTVRNYLLNTTNYNGRDGQKEGYDEFTLEGKVTYAIDSKASVFGGLKFVDKSFTTTTKGDQKDADKANELKHNYIFSVPIGIKVSF